MCEARNSKSTTASSLSFLAVLLASSMSGRRRGKSPRVVRSSAIPLQLESNVRRRVVYREHPRVYSYENNNYGCFGFVGDVVMTVLTGGLWLIWIFVREMRRR